MFRTDEDEAVLSWKAGVLTGSLYTRGQSWILENCGKDCFLWIQYK